MSEGEAGWSRGRRLTIGVARGVAMGCADVVPGVSGGTIAVALGIYERLLGAVRSLAGTLWALLRGSGGRVAGQRLAEVDRWLIIPLLAGILGAVIALASVIETLLEEHPETVAGLFCGLVAASAVAACRLFNWRDGGRITVAVASAAATFALLGLRSGPVTEPSLPVLFGAGAVAVCAMILPGVSGAFLLLMLGMYGAVITIVNEVRLLEATVFALGAATGLAMFSSLLGRLLEQSRDTVMAVLVGLMAGSFRVLWPWPDGVGVISGHAGEIVSGSDLAWPSADQWLAPTVAAAAGFAAVAVLVLVAAARE